MRQFCFDDIEGIYNKLPQESLISFFRKGRGDKCFLSQYVNNQSVGSIAPAKRNDSVGGKIAQRIM